MEPSKKSLTFILKLVKQQLFSGIKLTLPNITPQDIKIQGVNNSEDIEYNSPLCLQIFNKQKKNLTQKNVQELCQLVVNNFKPDNLIQNLGTTEQGFLTIKLQDTFVEDQINSMLRDGIVYPLEKQEKVLVDFSSPNIAKEMHVGHLRSTIIGESICRILEFMGHDVLRINHVGDWGTQFGMLIQYLKEAYPTYNEQMPNLSDLTAFYKEAKKRFDADEAFKKNAQLTVVELQSGNPDYLKAWQVLCDISRKEFEKVYKRLQINVKEMGESFYNPFIPDAIKEAQQKGIVVEDKSAKCIFIGKPYKIPLIIQKSDGGFNYDSTDFAAIKYRFTKLQRTRLIYITDVGQREHFEMIIKAAQMMGWHQPPQTRAEHMGFGVILGEDGQKFKTRSGKTVKLTDLLDEARDRALAQIKSRSEENKKDEESKENTGTLLSEEEYLNAAEKIGMAAIKYYDLRQNRISDYKFSYDKMLDTKGNTAVYLLYSFARINQIIKKSGYTEQEIQELIQKKGFKITHPSERYLAAYLIKFTDIIENVVDDLMINRLTDYIYDVAVKIGENYNKYRIIDSEHKETRILLCIAVRNILKICFHLVGIEPLERL